MEIIIKIVQDTVIKGVGWTPNIQTSLLEPKQEHRGLCPPLCLPIHAPVTGDYSELLMGLPLAGVQPQQDPGEPSG